MKRVILLFLTIFILFSFRAFSEVLPLPGGNDRWQLIWNDEFDYPNENLDAFWYSANGPRPGILSSRWRKNAVVSDGTLKLNYIKETLGGQDWTAGSIWTKQDFKYGYFECRFRYAAAPGTNNSFWLISPKAPPIGKQFEIDINEGHYPNEINTNLHNLTDVTVVDGVSTHPTYSKTFNVSSARPDYSFIFDTPIITKKIRLFSTNPPGHFHIPEFRIYNVNPNGYPDVFSPTADTDINGLINYARETTTSISASGVYNSSYPPTYAADGTINRHWVSQALGDKWIQFDFTIDKTIGCIQFINGWSSSGDWVQLLTDYKIQYHNGLDWVDIKSYNSLEEIDLSKEFHTYGLEWNEKELIYYYDRKELRRIPNTFCYSPAPVYLSAAVINGAGPVTDAIDGTRMEVDYVRIYKTIPQGETKNYVVNGGFENPQSKTDWKYLRKIGNFSSYSLLTRNILDNQYALRINAESSNELYGAYVTQKIAVYEGKYRFSFQARKGDSNIETNKLNYKLINSVTGNSIILDDLPTDMEIEITQDWQTYSFVLNLKEDYSGKIVFGFGNEGVYDLDNVSLIKIDDTDNL